jgi:hypothetical protein
MLNYKLITGLSLGVAIALSTSGCANKDQNVDVLNQKNQQIMELQKKLNEKNTKITELEDKSVQASNSNSSHKDENAVSNSLVPPNAKVGECYAKVLVPEKVEEKTKNVLVEDEKTKIELTQATYKVIDKKITLRAETKKINIIPAVYEEVESEKVLIEPERTELIVVPATYKTVEEKIVIKEQKIVNKVIPATYKEVEEKVLISDAHTAWKKGRGEIEKVDNSTGDIMCLVNVPAKYQTITKKLIDTPSRTEQTIIPAVYKTVKSTVIDVPAHTKEKVIPAVYKTVTKKVLKTPAKVNEVIIPAICKITKVKVIDTPSQERNVTIPAVYEDYTVKVKTADSYLRWQPILCETNTKPGIISKLQKELKNQGYDIKSVNGKYDNTTKAAVNKYQEDKQLSTGALTLKTLESLGLN